MLTQSASWPGRRCGYGVAQTLQAVHVKAALQMALEQLPVGAGKTLIHYSDRGIQYCSTEYVSLLDTHQIRISMTEDGDPLENAIAERVNEIIKNEYLAHQPVLSLAQAQESLQQAVFLYNFKRPHLSCDMFVPDEAHKREGKLKRRWKNYYHKKLLTSLLVNDKTD